MQIKMDHLPGFWDEENWSDQKWAKYLKNQKERSWLRRSSDQMFHRWMGKFLSEEYWIKREGDQWPSSTGSYDPCEDHYNWLLGAGRKKDAEELKAFAKSKRPEFKL